MLTQGIVHHRDHGTCTLTPCAVRTVAVHWQDILEVASCSDLVPRWGSRGELPSAQPAARAPWSPLDGCLASVFVFLSFDFARKIPSGSLLEQVLDGMFEHLLEHLFEHVFDHVAE